MDVAEVQEEEEEGSNPDQVLAKKEESSPPAFVMYQRMIRTNIFFSPYLKYVFQMSVSNDRLFPNNENVNTMFFHRQNR